MCAALEQRSETGSINLTEVQIACLSLWRDPKAESLFDATPSRAEVIQRLLEGHLTGSLDRLSSGLREPAVAVLRHLVTSAGTRNIVLESDLLERLRTSENIPSETGKRALAELSGQSRLVRRQRRNEAYFYDIMSEFLVPWIQRQRVLSDARVTMRKLQKRVALGVGIALAGVLTLAGISIYLERERSKAALVLAKLHEQKIADEKLQSTLQQHDEIYQEQRKIDGVDTEQRALDSVASKEEISPEVPVTSVASGDDAGRPPDADSLGALDYITDKLFVGHKGAVWNVHYSTPAIGVVFPGKSDTYCITAGRDQTARVWDW